MRIKLCIFATLLLVLAVAGTALAFGLTGTTSQASDLQTAAAASCCPDGACCPTGDCCGTAETAAPSCCPTGVCCPDDVCCGTTDVVKTAVK